MYNVTTTETADSVAAVTAKVGPPVGVSIATVAGIHIHELVIWSTLIYTVLMIGHKIYRIYREIKDNNLKDKEHGDED
jgi:hypothetical protein